MISTSVPWLRGLYLCDLPEPSYRPSPPDRDWQRSPLGSRPRRMMTKPKLKFNSQMCLTDEWLHERNGLHVLGFLASSKGPNLSFFIKTKHMWRIRMVKNVQELGFWRTSGLDRDFDIITFHVTHFWNPWDFRNKMKPYLRLFVTIWMIREVNNVTKI